MTGQKTPFLFENFVFVASSEISESTAVMVESLGGTLFFSVAQLQHHLLANTEEREENEVEKVLRKEDSPIKAAAASDTRETNTITTQNHNSYNCFTNTNMTNPSLDKKIILGLQSNRAARGELDYCNNDNKSIKKFGSDGAKLRGLRIPVVYERWITACVVAKELLTMEGTSLVMATRENRKGNDENITEGYFPQTAAALLTAHYEKNKEEEENKYKDTNTNTPTRGSDNSYTNGTWYYRSIHRQLRNTTFLCFNPYLFLNVQFTTTQLPQAIKYSMIACLQFHGAVYSPHLTTGTQLLLYIPVFTSASQAVSPVLPGLANHNKDNNNQNNGVKESKKLQMARKKNILCGTVKWLQECVKQNKILPLDISTTTITATTTTTTDNTFSSKAMMNTSYPSPPDSHRCSPEGRGAGSELGQDLSLSSSLSSPSSLDRNNTLREREWEQREEVDVTVVGVEVKKDIQNAVTNADEERQLTELFLQTFARPTTDANGIPNVIPEKRRPGRPPKNDNNNNSNVYTMVELGSVADEVSCASSNSKSTASTFSSSPLPSVAPGVNPSIPHGNDVLNTKNNQETSVSDSSSALSELFLKTFLYTDPHAPDISSAAAIIADNSQMNHGNSTEEETEKNTYTGGSVELPPSTSAPHSASRFCISPPTVLKRGRGRPRKNTANNDDNDDKVCIQTKSVTSASEDGLQAMKRGRGRPPKHVKKAENNVKTNSIETTNASAVSGPVPLVKRGRGRPCKRLRETENINESQKLKSAVPSDNTNNVKRGPGRPKKYKKYE